MKLLVVDDSELIRSRLVVMLEAVPGVEAVGVADSLAQALHRVAQAGPELLILDLHLPDGNALRMLPLFRRMAPEMHIAVLTNDATPFNSERCLQAGANVFLDKSREFEKVLTLVRERAGVSESVSSPHGRGPSPLPSQ